MDPGAPWNQDLTIRPSAEGVREKAPQAPGRQEGARAWEKLPVLNHSILNYNLYSEL